MSLNPNEQDIVNFEKSRAIYTFTVPDSIARKAGVKEVGLVELTAEEEMRAAARGQMNPLKITAEQAKEALRRVDGKPVSTADGSVDLVWNRFDPRLRTLILGAYTRIHQPSNEENDVFLSSVTVG